MKVPSTESNDDLYFFTLQIYRINCFAVNAIVFIFACFLTYQMLEYEIIIILGHEKAINAKHILLWTLMSVIIFAFTKCISGFAFLLYDSLRCLKLHLMLIFTEVVTCLIICPAILFLYNSLTILLRLISLNLLANMVYAYVIYKMIEISRNFNFHSNSNNWFV